MSTNEKTSVATYTAIDQQIEKYNAELENGANVVTLADIETAAKAEAAKAGKELMKAALQGFVKYEQPMMECARKLAISVPTVKIDKEQDSGAPVRMYMDWKSTQLNPVELTKILGRYNHEKEGFPASGVFTNGMSWTYKCERFAQLMTERVAKDLEVDSDAQKSIKDTYKLSKKAKEVTVSGKDPTGNKAMVGMLQEILDAMLFIDNGNGGNLVRCTNKDLEFIQNKFTSKDSKDAMAVRVAAGRNIISYVFQVAHALITGEPYKVTGFKQNDGADAVTFKPFRDPLPESKLRVKPETTEKAA